jgi:hypothetical protein
LLKLLAHGSSTTAFTKKTIKIAYLQCIRLSRYDCW